MGYGSPARLAARVLIILLAGLTACSPRTPDCRSENVFCAGLVTDTNGLKDFGLNQSIWAGLEQAHAAGLADQIASIESVNPRDYEKNIAWFVEAGYDVIFTSGPGLRQATLRSADLYPDSVFIGMNQPDEGSKPNFISVQFPEDQMGFLAGYLAARLTTTRSIGAVCEASGIDSMWRYCEGFRAGAEYADEQVRIIVAYRDEGSRDTLFNDPQWGEATVRSLVEEGGVDVVFAAGGETASGALRAAGVAGIRAIGVERDQRAALAEEGSGVAVSLWGDAGSTVPNLIVNIKKGDLADAPLNPVMFAASEGVVPNRLLEEAGEILTGLADGSLMTNVTFEKP